MVTSRPFREERADGSTYGSRRYVFIRLSGVLPTTPQLRLRVSVRSSFTLLDEHIAEVREACTQLPDFTGMEVLENLRERLLDADLPEGATEQAPLPEGADVSA